MKIYISSRSWRLTRKMNTQTIPIMWSSQDCVFWVTVGIIIGKPQNLNGYAQLKCLFLSLVEPDWWAVFLSAVVKSFHTVSLHLQYIASTVTACLFQAIKWEGIWGKCGDFMDWAWKWLMFHDLEFNHLATPHCKDGCKLVQLYTQVEEVWIWWALSWCLPQCPVLSLPWGIV